MTSFAFYLSICAFFLVLIPETLSHNSNPLLLLISLDGFRYDYLEKVAQSGRKTPNFDILIDSGVHALHVKNRFITKTYPNHYSIATGYDEESHGVTANQFHDDATNKTYNIYSNEDVTNPMMWNNGTIGGGAEPIWITNEKSKEHSVVFKKRSGVMMWPGAGAEIHGVKPTYGVLYNRSYADKEKIDILVSWFASEEKPINLGVLYYDEPDGTGHKFGPNSVEILDKIVYLDGLMGYLLQKLEKHNLQQRINIILTSDHGMAQIDNHIQLNDYLNASLYDMYGSSPVLNIEPKPGKFDEVYNKLKAIPHLTTYKKEDIPREYYYTYNNRIQPIVISAELGYNVIQAGPNPNKGNHGYNNSLDVMHPLFIASGPSFKKNYKAKPFTNIDIYPLMCHLLEIDPYPNNGSFVRIKHILFTDEKEGLLVFDMTILTFLFAVGFAALVSGIFCISAFRSYRILLRRKRPMVVRLNNVHDGHTHLLSNTDDEDDEEEIP